MNGTYERAHVRSLEHSEDFWADAAEQIDWFRPWDRVLDELLVRLFAVLSEVDAAREAQGRVKAANAARENSSDNGNIQSAPSMR